MQKEAKKAQEDNPKITEERERKEMEYEKDRGKLDADEQEIVIKVQQILPSFTNGQAL